MQVRRSNVLVQFQHQVTQLPFFEQVHSEYMQSMKRKGLSKFTLKHEKENLQAVTKLIPNGTNLLSYNAQELEEMIFDKMRNSGLNPNTINNRLKTLRRFFQFAQTQGYIKFNSALQVIKMKSIAPVIPSLSSDQIRHLLMQPDCNTFTGLRDKTIILLMLDNGIRLREALELTCDQIDLKARIIRSIKGKNGKLEDLPITSIMCKQFQIYLQHRGQIDSSILFTSIDNMPLNRRTFQERLKLYGDKAGIRDVRVSPHTLRHTFSKQWILNGGDIFSLQKVLRHSTMDMVKKYVHLWGHEVQQMHDQFSPLSTLIKR